MASLGRLGKTAGSNWAMFGVYTLSQIIGAFASSFFVWFAYAPVEQYLIDHNNMTGKGLSGLYATWPSDQGLRGQLMP